MSVLYGPCHNNQHTDGMSTRGILHKYHDIRPGPVQDIVGEGARTAAWS